MSNRIGSGQAQIKSIKYADYVLLKDLLHTLSWRFSKSYYTESRMDLEKS
jgi:hypothetical protein